MKNLTTRPKTRLMAAAMALAATPALAIDVGPADYTIMPSGTTLGVFYFQHLSSDTLHVAGSEVPGSKFSADVAILRGLWYTDLGGETVLWNAVLPISSISTARIGGADQPVAEGVGDLTLGLTYWPVKPSNPETGTTLGLSLFVTAPTGKYEFGSVGIGEGTWQFTPQVGLIQGLGNGFYFDGVVDVAISLDHDENGIEVSRDPSWQVQAMLRKQFTPTTSIAIGYNGHRGGAQKFDGVETGLKNHRDQIRLYGSTFLTEDFQIQGMIGRDINVKGGFEYDTVAQIRLMKVF